MTSCLHSRGEKLHILLSDHKRVSTYQKSFRNNNGLSGLRHQDYGYEDLFNSTLELDFFYVRKFNTYILDNAKIPFKTNKSRKSK